MEAIKVLHMIGSLNVGGSQAMMMNLLEAVDRSLVEIDFVIDHPDELYFADRAKELGAKIYVMPAFTGRNFSEIKAAWRDFFAEHKEYKILHSHVRSYASVFIPVAKKMGLKTIIHSHSTSNGGGLKSVIKKLMQYPLRRQADYFFGCSPRSGEWLFGKKIVNSDRYYTIANSVDTSKFRFNATVRDEVRGALGLGDKRTFIHVGRLHEAKNHEFLIDVFAKIHALDENSVLLCLGDGDLMKPVCEKIATLGLDGCVKMLGSRSDVERYLMAADVFLFPSKWEGVPVTVVEAQAAGLPCLVSDRITDDVCVSELVKKLPIDQGVEVWADAASSVDGRTDATEKIIKAGYDVKENARWLEKFYLELTK